MPFTTQERITIYEILDIPYPIVAGENNTTVRVIEDSFRGAIQLAGELTTATPSTLDSFITTYVETDNDKMAFCRDRIAEWEDVRSVTAKIGGPNGAVGALGGAAWSPDEQRKNIRSRLQIIIPFMRADRFRRTDQDGKVNINVPGVR